MQSYVLFIGIDISKKWIDVCLTLDGYIKQMPHQQFDNDLKGFKAMLAFITSWFKQQVFKKKDTHTWIFCLEHTGVYSFPICNYLQKQNLHYSMVNPLHLKKSLGIRRGKSDRADAADIARYAFIHSSALKLSQLPSDKLLIIKNLLSLRGRLVKSRKGLDVAAKELKQFAPTVSRDVLKYSKKNSKQLNQTIKSIEVRITQIIHQDDELTRLYQLLCSIKGVGLIIGSALLVYTVGFTAFESSRQFATYIGLAPFSKSSGSSIYVPAKVSHLAHKKLKGWISNGASVATQYDKELKVYYERRVAQGKNKHVVQNAIRNKFLHRVFAVVKRGSPYVQLARYSN